MTAIEWTDETWNPTVGCSRISPGCDNCYAIGVAHRAMQPAHVGLTVRKVDFLPSGEAIEHGRPDWTGEVRELEERLDVPFRWKRPRRVFVDSMSDLFLADDLFVASVFAVMSLTPQHTYQVLTKRHKALSILDDGDWRYKVGLARMRLANRLGLEHVAPPWPLPNVWLGVSVETQRYADLRIPTLLEAPAVVRFLSVEPLLGPVDLGAWLHTVDGRPTSSGLGWVIAGGESGPGARPMHPSWVRSIRDQCSSAGVPFFFKQWGALVPYEADPQPPFWNSQHGDTIDGHHLPAELTDHERVDGWWWPADLAEELDDTPTVWRWVGKKVAGRELDGRTWDGYPTERTGTDLLEQLRAASTMSAGELRASLLEHDGNVVEPDPAE